MISLKQMNQKGVLEAKRTKVWSRRRPKRYGSPRHPYRVRERKLNCFREEKEDHCSVVVIVARERLSGFLSRKASFLCIKEPFIGQEWKVQQSLLESQTRTEMNSMAEPSSLGGFLPLF